MVDPLSIKNEFKKVEDENYRFRKYLKIHANEDELDEKFLQLHNELFLNYNCKLCRNCCKEYSTNFDEEEIEEAAKFLEIDKDDFIEKYLHLDMGEYITKEIPCIFLNEDGECKIETYRPASCRDFPFINKPERLKSLYSIIEFARVCPVVFEIIERLKMEYKFKIR